MICHQIFRVWRSWLEPWSTWLDMDLWPVMSQTLVLSPFHRMHSELIYICKDCVHLFAPPAGQGDAEGDLDSC